MSVINVTQQRRLFGMFELDSTNTVLYSRVEADGRGDFVTTTDINGHDLFNDNSPILNAGELRQRVNHFRASGAMVDSFDFTCQYDDGPVPVRVLLARVRERFDYDSTKSILIHLRRRL